MVHDTLPSQDASTYLIWNSYLKEYRSFAPDLMQILKTRSEVKVTVTGKWNGTICNSKMHSHTKLPSKMHLHTEFGIPTLKNIRDVLHNSIVLKTCSEVKVTVTRIWYVTLCHPKMHFYTKFGIPTSKYRRYARDSNQFLETRSEVKVNVTGTHGWRATLFHPKMHPHTKFGIPSSNNIGDMLRKRSF